MGRYVYPAVFAAEDGGLYSIVFPDIENCYTSGENLAEGISNAQDVLALTLYGYEERHQTIPEATPINEVLHDEESFVTYIEADTLEYQKKFNRKSVKKTLTIPEWLNDAAVKANINFSQVLQEALKEKLHVE